MKKRCNDGQICYFKRYIAVLFLPPKQSNMKTRDFRCVVALSVLTVFACACTGSSQEEATEAVFLNGFEAASEHYTLISEKENVRVIDMFLHAGKRDNLHSHNWETVYFISGGQAKLYVGDNAIEAEIPDGYVMHHEPWTHRVENIGNTDIRAIIVEQTDEVIPVEPYDGYIDPLEASPSHYTLLSEVGNVRVLHMKLGPGERDALHSHYYETVYFLTGGRVNIYVGDELMEADIPDGYVLHHEPWTHSVENVGDTTIEAIIFEIQPAEKRME